MIAFSVKCPELPALRLPYRRKFDFSMPTLAKCNKRNKYVQVSLLISLYDNVRIITDHTNAVDLHTRIRYLASQAGDHVQIIISKRTP